MGDQHHGTVANINGFSGDSLCSRWENTHKMMLMLNGFKEFIMRGNVIDLAVGVIIGGAFGTVVNALVEAVIMPAIALVLSEPNFDNWLVLGGSVKVGVFLTAVVNFLLIAAALYFCIVLPINKMNEARARKLGLEDE